MSEELKNYFIGLVKNCSMDNIDFNLEAASMELDENAFNEVYNIVVDRYLEEDVNV